MQGGVIGNIPAGATVTGFPARDHREYFRAQAALYRLAKIVNELEKGDLPLEKALALFEEGIQLSGSCRKELETAEGKVEILLKQNGKLQPEPFEAEKAQAKR